MSRKCNSERTHLLADMAAINTLLQQLDAEDVMTRFSLEARRDELSALIAEADKEVDEPTASVSLFFGGGPVRGTRAIESEFAGNAIRKFQDLVSTVIAQTAGPLGQRGVVPRKSSSTLHITDIARGSVGFVLEEVRSQPRLAIVDSPLRAAVNETIQLLDAFADPDDACFHEAVAATDQRVFASAREFFSLVRKRGATFRLSASKSDRSFGSEEVARAAARATSTTTKQETEVVRGQLAGVLPDAHRFEFIPDDPRGTISGAVDRALAPDVLAGFNREWVGVDAESRIVVKRVFRNGAQVKQSFMLIGLAKPAEA